MESWTCDTKFTAPDTNDHQLRSHADIYDVQCILGHRNPVGVNVRLLRVRLEESCNSRS